MFRFSDLSNAATTCKVWVSNEALREFTCRKQKLATSQTRILNMRAADIIFHMCLKMGSNDLSLPFLMKVSKNLIGHGPQLVLKFDPLEHAKVGRSVNIASGSQRLLEGESARSVSSHCDDVFKRVNLALQDIEKGAGKMHFALRGHCESMFALGCHVGFVEKCLRKMPQTCILRSRLG